MMSLNFDGKVALITGGGTGIGAATARLLAANGASVVLAGIPEDSLERTAADIRAAGGRCIAAVTDVTDERSVQGAIGVAVSEYGRLDILIANAGIQRHNADVNLPALDADEWQLTQDVNLRGVFLAAKHAVAQMIDQGDGGAVVIVSSVTAISGMSPNLSYSTSKAALLGFNRHIAVHYAQHGIRCNAVCPGALEQTPDWGEHPDPAGRESKMTANIPLGRLGTNSDIAPTIAFLVSDASAYTTGAQIVVDGGLTVR